MDDLRNECKEAQENPAKENLFRRFRLNQWVRQEVRYIPIHEWDECGKVPFSLEDFKGKRFYCGLDLASRLDITAFVMNTYDADNDIIYVIPFFWIPEDNMVQRIQRDKVPYDVWTKQGFIYTTPGNIIDYDFIRAKINELQGDYEIVEIAYDRWGMAELAPKLENDGFKIVPFGQGFHDMSYGTKELAALVKAKKIQHANNPVLRWMMDNTVIRIDSADSQKPDKGKSTERIDGIVAEIMALTRLLVNKETDVGSTYDDNELVVL
jgi:phage terminase large subunit-like protein